jgi:hypothetical protein
MRRNGGRNENDLLKVKNFPNLFCTAEVTQMNRIESPSKEPDSPSS